MFSAVDVSTEIDGGGVVRGFDLIPTTYQEPTYERRGIRAKRLDPTTP